MECRLKWAVSLQPVAPGPNRARLAEPRVELCHLIGVEDLRAGETARARRWRWRRVEIGERRWWSICTRRLRATHATPAICARASIHAVVDQRTVLVARWIMCSAREKLRFAVAVVPQDVVRETREAKSPGAMRLDSAASRREINVRAIIHGNAEVVVQIAARFRDEAVVADADKSTTSMSGASSAIARRS